MSFLHLHGRICEVNSLDEYAGTSRLRKMDARSKLVGVLIFVVASALLTSLDVVFVSFLFASAFVVTSAIPLGHTLRLYIGALPFIVIASLSLFLFSGLENGIAMLLRASACVLALIVLASGTYAFELFSGLRRLKAPSIITTLLMLTHRYIGLLAGELSRMTLARRARGFRGGMNLLDKFALKVISYTAGMVFVRSSERADRAYEGLKSKGFDKNMIGWRTTSMEVRDYGFIVGMVAVSTVLLAMQTELIL